ncbi:hypothetical protein CEUSTIGMA_g9925.t1 [Chlamydomonas eustigma]|uniref:Uncharacterized protein n=1 Tax=Chlamydomonas eustigma TaxID=1157962 RepID=A0A250XHE7_9CHLO|nr:hypothetical protein CEUSTIGMA_g9925.t1 [Chlamydomonas eustigma]|eukprot:GAX82498.1 hypothetical protein CEUSTIGMA_g9925.t1 [Chlamydomonas eustigma]
MNANRSTGHFDVSKRKFDFQHSLKPDSDHETTMEWISTFLDKNNFDKAKKQLAASAGGDIDGEVLFSISAREELCNCCGFDFTVSTKIWNRLKELQKLREQHQDMKGVDNIRDGLREENVSCTPNMLEMTQARDCLTATQYVDPLLSEPLIQDLDKTQVKIQIGDNNSKHVWDDAACTTTAKDHHMDTDAQLQCLLLSNIQNTSEAGADVMPIAEVPIYSGMDATVQPEILEAARSSGKDLSVQPGMQATKDLIGQLVSEEIGMSIEHDEVQDPAGLDEDDVGDEVSVRGDDEDSVVNDIADDGNDGDGHEGVEVEDHGQDGDGVGDDVGDQDEDHGHNEEVHVSNEIADDSCDDNDSVAAEDPSDPTVKESEVMDEELTESGEEEACADSPNIMRGMKEGPAAPFKMVTRLRAATREGFAGPSGALDASRRKDDSETGEGARDSDADMDEERCDEDDELLKPVHQTRFLLCPTDKICQDGQVEDHNNEVMFCSVKGKTGLWQMLGVMSREQLVCVGELIGISSHECCFKNARRRIKETGEMEEYERRRPDSDMLKLVRSRHGILLQRDPAVDERSMMQALSTMTKKKILVQGMIRYLKSYFSSFPEVKSDYSNLDTVIISMWKTCKEYPRPPTVTLGTRRIVLTTYHEAVRIGLHNRGMLRTLVQHIVAKEVRLNKCHHKDEDCEEILQWLQNAAKLAEGSIAAPYEIVKRKGRVVCTITFVLKMQEVYGGAGDLLELLHGLDEYRSQTEILQRCGTLSSDFSDKAMALGLKGVPEQPQGEGGCTSVGELEGMLENMEECTHEDPHEATHKGFTSRYLKQQLMLRLRPYQLHALCHHLQEENGPGLGRHLWTELPVLMTQKPFHPQTDGYNSDRDINEDAIFKRIQEDNERHKAPSKEQQARHRAERAARRAEPLKEANGSSPMTRARSAALAEAGPSSAIKSMGLSPMTRARPAALAEAGPSSALKSMGPSPMTRARAAALIEAGPSSAVKTVGPSPLTRSRAAAAEEHGCLSDAKASSQAACPSSLQVSRASGEANKTSFLPEGGSHVVSGSHEGDGLEQNVECNDDDDDGDRVESSDGGEDFTEEPAQRFNRASAHIPLGQIHPKDLRLFFSPVLNAMYWGTSLRSMSGTRQLSVSTTRGGCLWLEMGMGKTAVMIALMTMPTPPTWKSSFETPAVWDESHLYDKDLGYAPKVIHKAKTLVVVCNTLVHQWQGEIKRFTRQNLNVKIFYGKEKRHLLPAQLGDYDVIIATPDGLSSEKTLQSVLWHRIIVDEAHQVPGLLQTVQSMPAMAKYCLTGTPYSDKASDIARMLSMLGMPSYSLLARNNHKLGFVLERFAVRYTTSGELDGQQNLPLTELTEVKKLVTWHPSEERKFIRFQEKTKDDLEAEFERVEKNQRKKAELEEHLRSHYYSEEELSVQPWRVVNNYLMPLRQACACGIPVLIPMNNNSDDMSDVDKGPLSDDDSQVEQGHHIFGSKVRALLQEVQGIIRSDNQAKILIFSSFQNTLTYVNKYFSRKGFQFRTIDSGMTMAKKGEALQAFQTDPPTTIFLLNANVATVGLNLTAANHIILMEPSMNPAQEKQAICRAYRMGQKRDVQVMRLAMKDTVEARIWDLMEKRLEAGKLKEMATSASGVVQAPELGPKGKKLGKRPGQPQGRRRPTVKAARNLANDTTGFERSTVVDELCWLMNVQASVKKRLDMEDMDMDAGLLEDDSRRRLLAHVKAEPRE